jgi:hypothetical protein
VDEHRCTLAMRMGTPLASLERTYESSVDKKMDEENKPTGDEAGEEEGGDDGGDQDPVQVDNPAMDHDDGALNNDTDETRFKRSCREYCSESTKSNNARGGYRCLLNK